MQDDVPRLQHMHGKQKSVQQKQFPGAATAGGPSPAPPFAAINVPIAQAPHTWWQIAPPIPPAEASQQPHHCDFVEDAKKDVGGGGVSAVREDDKSARVRGDDLQRKTAVYSPWRRSPCRTRRTECRYLLLAS